MDDDGAEDEDEDEVEDEVEDEDENTTGKSPLCSTTASSSAMSSSPSDSKVGICVTGLVVEPTERPPTDAETCEADAGRVAAARTPTPTPDDVAADEPCCAENGRWMEPVAAGRLVDAPEAPNDEVETEADDSP
jgi:hypothetical protein